MVITKEYRKVSYVLWFISGILTTVLYISNISSDLVYALLLSITTVCLSDELALRLDIVTSSVPRVTLNLMLFVILSAMYLIAIA